MRLRIQPLPGGLRLMQTLLWIQFIPAGHVAPVNDNHNVNGSKRWSGLLMKTEKKGFGTGCSHTPNWRRSKRVKLVHPERQSAVGQREMVGSVTEPTGPASRGPTFTTSGKASATF